MLTPELRIISISLLTLLLSKTSDMTPIALGLIVIYVVGFFVSLFIWSKFGKKYWTDYDAEKTYADYDDWSSNQEAYTAFSLGWPIFLAVFILRMTWLGLVKLCKTLIDRYSIA